jgi:hypothetical protein
MHNSNWDVFVLRLNQSGLSLDYSTFVGGAADDHGRDIVLDSVNNAIVTGSTSSFNFPNSTGVFDPDHNGNWDAFVCKLNQTGGKLIFSTFIGDLLTDMTNGIDLDPLGNIYITGDTFSSNFPTTIDAFYRSLNGTSDAYLVIFNQNCTKLLYSSYIGGSGMEYGYGIALDSIGNVYLAGSTRSTGFPTTNNAFDTSHGGAEDGFVLKLTASSIININSLSILESETPTNMIYSKLGPYTFRIELIDSVNFTDLDMVFLTLDPNGAGIQLSWNCTTGKFSKLSDPNNYVTLEPTSKYNNYLFWWTIDFIVTFNWTYPNEKFQDVQAKATSKTIWPTWLNGTGIYNVENDLVFNGTLLVEGENDRTIHEKTLVRGGETLRWTSLTPVYENTTEVYPPTAEYHVTILDELGSSWSTSPAYSEPFYIETLTPNITYNSNFNYTIKISDIPTECDKSNKTFDIRIDANNVTFSNPLPLNATWQTSNDVSVSVHINDPGGGTVNGESVMFRTSNNDGDSWSEWKYVHGLDSNMSIIASNFVSLKEGKKNLIKWRAADSVGNGPNESQPYRIIVDIRPVIFSNFQPLATDISTTEEVEVSVTISDDNSGVNAATIEYSISIDKGKTWGDWLAVDGYSNDMEVIVKSNLTFPNSSDNMIKWRASDIAGNGPIESPPFVIFVNTWIPIIKPSVELLSPLKGSIMNETNISFSWMLENINIQNVTYDLYFSNQSSIELFESNLTDTSFSINGLLDGEKYYWYIIPKLDGVKGTCSSGVWWFEIYVPKIQKQFELDITGPKSIMIEQDENKSIELTITNLGNVVDLVKLDLLLGNLSGYVTLDDYSIMKISSRKSVKRNLNISIPITFRPGIYSIIITAISINSGEILKENHIINIDVRELVIPEPPVIEDDKKRTDEKSNSLLLYLLITIVIIVILSLIITYFIYKKRKKQIEPGLLPGGSFALKPGALPSPVITLDQISTSPAVAQLPRITMGEGESQITTATAVVPVLAKSTQIIQPPVTQTESTPIPSLPQLPPAKIQDRKPEVIKTGEIATSTTPTIAQPTISVQGPTVHLPDTPPDLQKTPPIAKPVEPETSQTAPVTQQIPKPTLAQPQVQPTLAKGPSVPIEVKGEKTTIFTTPGTTPKKDQSVEKKDEEVV